MIDWLTLKIPAELLQYSTYLKLHSLHDRILRITPRKQILWETAAWQSIRSDTHGIVIRATDCITIQGSPARVMSTTGINVFGSSDIKLCARNMINYVARMLDVPLPLNLRLWNCCRIDYAQNYDMQSPVHVSALINYLKQSEGGRYRVNSTNSSIYYQQGSRLRSGVVYDKGKHIQYWTKKNNIKIDTETQYKINKLVRFELRLKSQFKTVVSNDRK